MNTNKYIVFVNGLITAESMPLDDVLIYVEGLFKHYENDVSLDVRIIVDVEGEENE